MRLRTISAALAASLVTLVGGIVVANAAEAIPCGEQLDIRTGYYRSGNGAPSSGVVGIESVTQYRSMADGSVWPGYQSWTTALPDDVERTYAIEFKYYGATVGTQTVNGKTVPAPAMHIQKRAGTTFPVAYGYGQMTSGALDPLLDRMNAQLKTMVAGRPNMRVNWQIASEFDTDHEFGTDEAGTTYTPAQSDVRAVQAITYMVNYLRDHGLPEQVTFTVGMAGIWRDSWLRMHPPSLAWIIDGGLQYNAYNHSTPGREPYVVFNMTKAWSVADLSARWLQKPIVIEEWGTPASQGDQATWLAKVPAAIVRMNSEPGPDVVRLNYFDSNPPWGTFDPRERGEAAYTAMMADSLFEPCAPTTPASSSAPSSPSPVPSASATLPSSPVVTVDPSTPNEDEPSPSNSAGSTPPSTAPVSSPPPCGG